MIMQQLIWASTESNTGLPPSVQKVLSSMKNNNKHKNITVDNESLYGEKPKAAPAPSFQIKLLKNSDASEETMLSRAYRAWQLGQVESANVLYDDVLAIDHTNQSALMALAIIYQKEYNFTEARAYYATILQIDPYNTMAISNYLSILSHEAPQTALTELENLEKENPDYNPIPANIGMIYYKLKNYGKAADSFAKALNLAPDNQVYRYNLALSLDHLGMDKAAINLYKQLIAAYQRGTTIPVTPELLYNRIHNLSH